MRFTGRLFRDGTLWLAEIPVLDAATQGSTRREAYAMVADLLRSLANQPDLTVEIHRGKNNEFEVSSPDTRTLISLLLRRQRQRSGLSLAEVAQRLGAKSRNTYARYERGTSMPTVEKLSELLRAVAPGRDLVLQQSSQSSREVLY
jgi:ribosome-binding protein aMBF1 (putative translation factor)